MCVCVWCVCVSVCACEQQNKVHISSRLFRVLLSSYTHRFVIKNLYVSPTDVLYVRFVRCSPGNAWFRDRGIRHL